MTFTGYKGTEEQRFWSKVRIVDSGCWEWQGSKSKGYGKFGLAKQPGAKRSVLVRAHKWAFLRYVGPVPAGKELHHKCDNPSCVNPTHLEAVTHRQNTLLGKSIVAINAAKTTCRRGHELNEQRTCLVCRRLNDIAKHKGNKRSVRMIKMYASQTAEQRKARMANAIEARRISRAVQ